MRALLQLHCYTHTVTLFDRGIWDSVCRSIFCKFEHLSLFCYTMAPIYIVSKYSPLKHTGVNALSDPVQINGECFDVPRWNERLWYSSFQNMLSFMQGLSKFKNRKKLKKHPQRIIWHITAFCTNTKCLILPKLQQKKWFLGLKNKEPQNPWSEVGYTNQKLILMQNEHFEHFWPRHLVQISFWSACSHFLADFDKKKCLNNQSCMPFQTKLHETSPFYSPQNKWDETVPFLSKVQLGYLSGLHVLLLACKYV